MDLKLVKDDFPTIGVGEVKYRKMETDLMNKSKLGYLQILILIAYSILPLFC